MLLVGGAPERGAVLAAGRVATPWPWLAWWPCATHQSQHQSQNPPPASATHLLWSARAPPQCLLLASLEGGACIPVSRCVRVCRAGEGGVLNELRTWHPVLLALLGTGFGWFMTALGSAAVVIKKLGLGERSYRKFLDFMCAPLGTSSQHIAAPSAAPPTVHALTALALTAFALTAFARELGQPFLRRVTCAKPIAPAQAGPLWRRDDRRILLVAPRACTRAR